MLYMDTRTAQLGLRATPDELALWKAEAKASDLSLSHYLRRMIAAGRTNTVWMPEPET